MIQTENGSGRGPFVILCDHASRRVPDDLGDLGLDEAALHDLGLRVEPRRPKVAALGALAVPAVREMSRHGQGGARPLERAYGVRPHQLRRDDAPQPQAKHGQTCGHVAPIEARACGERSRSTFPTSKPW